MVALSKTNRWNAHAIGRGVNRRANGGDMFSQLGALNSGTANSEADTNAFNLFQIKRENKQMRPKLIRSIIFFSICLIPALSVSAQSVPVRVETPYRILIDASKDGGLWWFPQAGTFDAAQHHQGKPFADMLRRDGAEVVELGRGVLVTTDTLKGFDLVIRVPSFFPYSPAEALAYRYRVAGGMRLLILAGGTRNRDVLAEAFGLYFESRTQFTSIKRWVRHPFTRNLDEFDEGVWSGLLRVPNEAVTLGWVSGSNDPPAMGYLPYGMGYVVFTGQAMKLGLTDSSAENDLIDSIVELPLDKLWQLPRTELIEVKAAMIGGPMLVEPGNDSYLSQPGKGEWRFDWEDIPAAVSYEIVILGPSASTPLVRLTVNKSELVTGRRDTDKTDDVQDSSYIADHNLRGWSWRVRALLSDGTWGAWSTERTFNIHARSTGR